MWEAPELFACLHILQMELLNCGLEQCRWNARHWRRRRNEEERKLLRKSALYSSQSHRVSNENSESLWFCRYWSQTSAVFLHTDVAHPSAALGSEQQRRLQSALMVFGVTVLLWTFVLNMTGGLWHDVWSVFKETVTRETTRTRDLFLQNSLF